MSRCSLLFCDFSLGVGFATLAPTVLGGKDVNVEGADFLATETFEFDFVAGIVEVRWMTARFLGVRDFTRIEGVDAVEDALGEGFFLGGGVAVSSSGSSACLREA